MDQLAHLLAVSSLVLEVGGTQDEAIAALLHDSLEDAGISREDLEERFGENVATIVSLLSQPPDVEPLEQRKAYINQVTGASDSVKLISAADSLHNLRNYSTTGAALWKPERAAYYKDLIDIYQGCDRIPDYWIKEFHQILKLLEF